MTVQVLIDCHLATMCPTTDDPLGIVRDAALVWQGDRLIWVGPRDKLPDHWRLSTKHECNGAWVTPGLIDCHTHLVWGGSRAEEFRLRLHGATYEDIARAGGGILSTVKATRAEDEETLLNSTLKRLDALLCEGVTTVEVKSGYGLDLVSEEKCLKVARLLAKRRAVDIRTTFLGAHALPPEFAGQADDYIDQVIDMLPKLQAKGLVDAVDVFCERIGFNLSQTERVFIAAKKLGLGIKLHAEQLSDSNGAYLAAHYGALSCDHLEWLNPQGALAMAQAGSVAVLLPGAFYFLRETKLPPVDLLREHRVSIALASDCNPGSSPCTSLLLMLNMGCTLFRLTPEEAIAGVTRNAAKALGLHDRGMLQEGLLADLAMWDIGHPTELCYAFGQRQALRSMCSGKWRIPHKVSN